MYLYLCSRTFLQYCFFWQFFYIFCYLFLSKAKFGLLCYIPIVRADFAEHSSLMMAEKSGGKFKSSFKYCKDVSKLPKLCFSLSQNSLISFQNFSFFMNGKLKCTFLGKCNFILTISNIWPTNQFQLLRCYVQCINQFIWGKTNSAFVHCVRLRGRGASKFISRASTASHLPQQS